MEDDEQEADLRKAYNLSADGKIAEAQKIYERLSRNGSTYAKIQLGYLLLKHRTSDEDVSNAELLLKEAAAQGDTLGKYYLGLLYEQIGRNAEAFLVIRELAESGYLPAVNRLGWYFEDGVGCVKDLKTAEHYRSHAARHGHFAAQRWLASQMSIGRRGLLLVPIGVVLYLKAVVQIFWHTLRHPSDPRVQG